MSKFGHWFRRPEDTYRQALTEFSRSLTLIVDFDQLLENLEGKLREIADIPRVMILLLNPETHRFEPAKPAQEADPESPPPPLILQADDKLVQWLGVNEMALVVEQNPGVVQFLTQREQTILEAHGVQIIVPLIVMNRINGMVLLGAKASGSFTRAEVDLLITLLGQSALAFENALLYREQKHRLRKMYRSDRLATIGQIAAGAAHEIRNPLTSIRSTIQYLKKKDPDEERREMMDELIAEVDRIDEIIRGMLSFSKPVKPLKEKVDLADLLQKTLNLTASTARRNRVEFRFTPPADRITLMADPQQLRQVFMNIILNAVQAMPQGGDLAIEMGAVALPGRASRIHIVFSDTGTGIPERELEHLFDPFYTTKNDGTGLGLSISYGIIQQHGGEIEVRSRHDSPPTGTTLTVILPEDEKESP